MDQIRFLDLFAPFEPYLPRVSPPEHAQSLPQRLTWTALALLIFLIMSHMPLYGIVSSDSSDPTYWLRMMVASNRGTLMELGITPLITPNTFLQFLLGIQAIKADMNNPEDQRKMQTTTKVMTMLFAFGTSVVYVASGMYGSPSELGAGICILLVVQLVGATLIVSLLDEMFANKYCLGRGGVNFFIATNVAETIIWKSFSPIMINTGRGPQFEGAVLSLGHMLFTWPDKRVALREAFFRQSQPNIMNLLATLLIFSVIVYLHGFHSLVTVTQEGANQSVPPRPIPLFYTSNMPILLQSALSSNVFLISQLLFTRFSENFFVRLVGSWGPVADGSSQLKAVSGLVYYMSPPLSVSDAFVDPIRTIVYLVYMVAACATFSTMWLEVSKSGPAEVEAQYKNSNIRTTSTFSRDLRRDILAAASFGGAILGLLCVTCDLLSALGSGTGILLMVTTIYDIIRSDVAPFLYENEKNGLRME